METISELTQRNAQTGKVEWMGTRPARREPLVSVGSIEVTPNGLKDDHYQSGGKRSVTLIQHEHLAVIASFLGKEKIHPEDLRRNIVVSGINLLGLRNRRFKIGTSIFEGTGLCAPCSRMEETFGQGGYTAVRGHGGITARIIGPGSIVISDTVTPV
ncbi:MAG: MOSC domain-containing protein [Pseudomonadota bacterium]